MTQSEKPIFNLNHLEELLEEWKSILHLEQWGISLRIRRQKDFLEGDNQARVLVYLKRKGEALK